MKIEPGISDDSKKQLFDKLADAFAEKMTSSILHRVDSLSTEVDKLIISEERRALSSFILHLLQAQIEYIAIAQLADVVAEKITSSILQRIDKHSKKVDELMRDVKFLIGDVRDVKSDILTICDSVLGMENEVKSLARLSDIDIKISEARRTLSSLTLSLLQNQMGYSAFAPEDIIVDADVVCHSDVHGEDYAEKSEITENIGAIVIADGISEGCDGSEVAARIACKTFIKFLEENYYKYYPLELLNAACEEVGKKVRETAENALSGGEEWKKFVSERNMEKYEEKIKTKKGVPIFASTLIAVYYVGNIVYTVHIGDGYILPVYREESVLRICPYLSGSTSLQTQVTSDRERGIRGDPHLSSFLLKDGELLVIGSDGANFGYTPRGGFPYVMFNQHLKESLQCGTIKDTVEGWFEKLKRKDAISDDFSMGMIQIHPSPHRCSDKRL